MWEHHCIQLLLLGVAFVNASPAWFYNTGYGNTNPSGVGCSSFTKEYDPYSGRVTYRCNSGSNGVSNNYLGIPSTASNGAKKAPYITRGALAFQQSSGRSRSGPQPKDTTYRSQAYGRSSQKGKAKSRRNRCPPGQIFQSELNICIDKNLGPPLPPNSQSSNSRQSRLSLFNRMVGDAAAPVRVTSNYQKSPWRASSSARQMTPSTWSIISVGKFDIKNRCKPNEILVSELDICLPINNCYPYGETC